MNSSFTFSLLTVTSAITFSAGSLLQEQVATFIQFSARWSDKSATLRVKTCCYWDGVCGFPIRHK
jgi:hypothetical protein